MTALMDEGIKRWPAKRNATLVMKIIQGKTTLRSAKEEQIMCWLAVDDHPNLAIAAGKELRLIPRLRRGSIAPLRGRHALSGPIVQSRSGLLHQA
ncbi:hypothetical protein [Cupriavidus sp. 8B]